MFIEDLVFVLGLRIFYIELIFIIVLWFRYYYYFKFVDIILRFRFINGLSGCGRIVLVF